MLEKLENILVGYMSRWVSLLAPVPNSYLVYRATVAHLAWPNWVAFVAALVVEFLGFSTMSTSLVLYGYNKNKRKSDPYASEIIAVYLLIIIYLIVTIALTILLDILPSLAIYAPAIFPLLSLCGVAIFAIQVNHRKRLAEIEEVKVETAWRRVERKAAIARKLPEESTELPAMKEVTSGNRAEQAKVLLREIPDISGTELGNRLGVSARQGRYIKASILRQLDKSEQQDESESKLRPQMGQ